MSTLVLATLDVAPNQKIEIQLVPEHHDVAAEVVIHWPPSNTRSAPVKFPDLAARITRVIANASTELARMKAGNRP